MLGSFGSSSEELHQPPHDNQSSSDATHHHHHQIHQQPPHPPPRGGFPTAALHMRQLLINSAELINQSDYTAAHRLIAVLSSSSSPYGDSTERLVHQFSKALLHRLNRLIAATTSLPLPPPPPPPQASNVGDLESDVALHQSSYLTLNKVTPFIRFCHLTANQAILEAIDGHQAIHILDFDIMHGVQWPPLMQAMAERFPPPTLRITGTGHDLTVLRRTGDRLAKFAHSLGLRFQFHPLLLTTDEDEPAAASAVLLLPDETLAVNCVLYLHRLLKDHDRLRIFLHRIKAMNPKIVTVAEREANHNDPNFVGRFVNAVDHYVSVFDSLEATLPPNSRERLVVERVWFGREIADVVAEREERRRERHERYRSWEVTLRSLGFSNVPLSPFALSQAKLLLRLHYPSEGYQLHTLDHSFFLAINLLHEKGLEEMAPETHL